MGTRSVPRSATARDLTQFVVSERLAPVLRRYGAERAILFGSIARGEPSHRSDVDVIVVQETEKRFLDRYDGLLEEMAAAIPEAPLEALIYTPDELARMSDRPFIRTALREGRVIYERQ